VGNDLCARVLIGLKTHHPVSATCAWRGVDQEVRKLRSEVQKECLSKKVKYEG
jgi:hypothetical protein